MKLYFSKGACSLAVRIAINEMDLQCDYESVDLKTKQTESGKNFLTINPKGSVPTLEITGGEILTEASVIQQYLADSAKATTMLPTVGNIKRYRVLEWLNYVATEMHKGVGILFNPKLTPEMKDDIFIPLVKRKLDYLDQHLKDHKYLMGDQATLPDGYLFTILRWVVFFKFELANWPNLNGYFNEMKARPAVQKALKDEGLPLH